MAVLKLASGKFQARLADREGRWLTRVFDRREDAREQDRIWKQQKREGTLGISVERHKTLNEFFEEWLRDQRAAVSQDRDTGWLDGQNQRYQTYIQPIIGKSRLREVPPQMIKRVLSKMAGDGKSEQTRKHVYGLLHKMFSDAIEDYRYTNVNPVLKKFRPSVPEREAPHLSSLNQIKKLLTHVEHREFGLGVWIQIYTGLRVGELQALRWVDLDLDSGRLFIRRAYVRKKNCFRDYPKGKRQYSIEIPPELVEKLLKLEVGATSEFVATSKTNGMLRYKSYLTALRGYCKELGFPALGTHGLRHTTTTLYRKHGASKDDVQQLFAHSSGAVTERYLHGDCSNLRTVAQQIRLFGNPIHSPTPPEKTYKSVQNLRLVKGKKSDAYKKRTKKPPVGFDTERRSF